MAQELYRSSGFLHCYQETEACDCGESPHPRFGREPRRTSMKCRKTCTSPAKSPSRAAGFPLSECQSYLLGAKSSVQCWGGDKHLGRWTSFERKRQSNPSVQVPALVMQWKGGRTSAGSGSWATPESRGSRAVGGRIRSQRIESGGVLPEAGVELGHTGALSEAARGRQSSTRKPLARGGGVGRRAGAGERFGGGIGGRPPNRSRARV